jgi:hypothetical protein
MPSGKAHPQGFIPSYTYLLTFAIGWVAYGYHYIARHGVYPLNDKREEKDLKKNLTIIQFLIGE